MLISSCGICSPANLAHFRMKSVVIAVACLLFLEATTARILLAFISPSRSRQLCANSQTEPLGKPYCPAFTVCGELSMLSQQCTRVCAYASNHYREMEWVVCRSEVRRVGK